MGFPRITFQGDRGLALQLGDEISDEVHARVVGCLGALDASRPEWVEDLVPSYASVLVVYDPLRVEPEAVRAWAERACCDSLPVNSAARRVEIPVWYEPSVGPDLEALAEAKGLSVPELIALHTAPEYRVYMLGFRPGFPFLGGLDARLAMPRLATPRTVVPAGSVAIGGKQTGIYPTQSAGGWRILGRTPVRLFDRAREPSFLLTMGDTVKFVAIDAEAFARAEGRA
jgi:inhibitor of KinA